MARILEIFNIMSYACAVTQKSAFQGYHKYYASFEFVSLGKAKNYPNEKCTIVGVRGGAVIAVLENSMSQNSVACRSWIHARNWKKAGVTRSQELWLRGCWGGGQGQIIYSIGSHDKELTLYSECAIRLLKCFKQGSDMIRSVFSEMPLFAEGQKIWTERRVRRFLEWSRRDIVAWIRVVATRMKINGPFQVYSKGRITWI